MAATMSDWLLNPMDLLSHLRNAFQDCPLGEDNGRHQLLSHWSKTAYKVLISHISSCTTMTAPEWDTHERGPGTGCKSNVAHS